MQTLEFPSVKAAWHFVQEAKASGYEAHLNQTVSLLSVRARWFVVAGSLLGGSLLGVLGAWAEAGRLPLPGLEPLFAAPIGAVTALLAMIGGSLGALLGGLLDLSPTPTLIANRPLVEVETDGGDRALEQLAGDYGMGHREAAQVTQPAMAHQLTPQRLTAWLLTVLAAGVLLTATSYIWVLAIAYGHGADQSTRVGWTMKNAQRLPATTPAEVGATLATMVGGPQLAIGDDPLTAAVLAPLAAAQGRTLVYGAGEATVDWSQIAQLAANRNVAVVVAKTEPAYALPAAYAAAFFRVPVVPLAQVETVLADGRQRLLLVAAPSRLISDDALTGLHTYGNVERVADENLYRHALRWARQRWGNFGWGMAEPIARDGYYSFTLANPADPALAAAGLPAAYRGNFGPLLYTPQDRLASLTDQYLWRLSPDFFAIPSDGPFLNVRVLGGPESVSYATQARADLALETHQYRNQVTGMSGLAALGWMWFFMGLAGFVWALFVMPKRLPDTGFYARLTWPLAMLTLGPLGIIAFFLCYHGRAVQPADPMPSYVRPYWASAVAATITGMGIGMALMIAAMYLFQVSDMPLFTWLTFTPFFWLGSPMGVLMWFLMVIPATVLSIFCFMGPMMAEMHGRAYWHGVRQATPVVVLSMVAASVGMWTFTWWWMNWEDLMAPEDLWLWVAPLWFGAAIGFFTALLPNYLMVRAGWKNGGM